MADAEGPWGTLALKEGPYEHEQHPFSVSEVMRHVRCKVTSSRGWEEESECS